MKFGRFLSPLVIAFAVVLYFEPGFSQSTSPADNLDRQLLDAVFHDDLAATRKALDAGANIEARDTNGETPLITAAEHNNVALVKLLLSKGANAGAKDKSEETALLHAARQGHAEAVEVLLQNTSDSEEKKLALFSAVEGGPVEIEIKDPPAGSPKPRSRGSSKPPESPWVRTVKLLLDKGGVDLDARDPYRGTPLISAAAHGQTDVVMFLLARGANIRATDDQGSTALIAAACECAIATMNSTYDIVKALLEKGADVNARDQNGTTALISAASGFGDAAIVKLLLDHGADPTIKDRDGDTALSEAMKKERADKIELLKQAIERAR